MIKSMTGFGRGEYSDGKRNVTCEIRTVNHRYADITVKMPKRYSFAEEMVKSIVKEKIYPLHARPHRIVATAFHLPKLVAIGLTYIRRRVALSRAF